MSSLQNESVEVSCLGRPFGLGMLYDMRSDVLIPGLTLWDSNDLQMHKNVIPKQFTKMEISYSDSFDDKAALMDISGSLKLSVLAGKVNVEGSAKYFNDNKKSTKQSRVTLKYHVSTQFEHLTMDHLASGKFKYTEMFENDLATHVVTAVLYGANAFFVFSRDFDSNEDVTKAEGFIKVKLSKLGSIEVEGSGKLDNSEKAETDKYSCIFYGDFTLPANPFSFEGAIEMYKKLPNMLGEKREYAVPLKVWLYPLAKLDSKAEKIVLDISNSLITTVSETIKSFNVADMRCDDLAVDSVAQMFPAFHQKICDVKEKCNHYKLDLLKKVGSLLPLIRGGQNKESALVDLLRAHEESPFSSTKLDQWIKIKEEELDILKAFLEKLEYPAKDVYKNTGKIFSHTENVVCFTFTSLDNTDDFLDCLLKYPEQKMSLKPESWMTTDVGQKMRKALKLFKGLKSSSKSDSTNFIVVSEHHTEHPGACIRVYGDECDEVVCFIPPSKPICSVTGAVTDGNITVKLSSACEATVKRNLEYKMERQEEWNCKPVKQEEEEVTLAGLNADTVYEIRCVAVGTLEGFPVTSDIITVKTI